MTGTTTLTETIAAYRRGLDRMDQLSQQKLITRENENALWAEHVDGHYDALARWTCPAQSASEAVEALRIVSRSVEADARDLVEPMVKAATGFLQEARQ